MITFFAQAPAIRPEYSGCERYRPKTLRVPALFPRCIVLRPAPAANRFYSGHRAKLSLPDQRSCVDTPRIAAANVLWFAAQSPLLQIRSLPAQPDIVRKLTTQKAYQPPASD